VVESVTIVSIAVAVAELGDVSAADVRTVSIVFELVS
jgi:hypothetical protein